jgi:guanine deaminase
LYLAKLAGANALGIDKEVGNFEPGKDADFVVLSKEVVEQVYIRGQRAVP